MRSAASPSVRWSADGREDRYAGPLMADDDDLAALVIEDTRDKMHKAIDHLRSEMSNVRTGRASSALLEPLIIDYYGTPTVLRQLAGFSVPDAMIAFSMAPSELLSYGVMTSNMASGTLNPASWRSTVGVP